MTTTTEPTEQFIDPTEWKIRGSLRHGGITYGPAEPTPTFTMADALRYERSGLLARINPDGSLPALKTTRPEPQSAEEYLRGRDEIVLRHILDFHPGKKLLQEMQVLAKGTGRTQYLRMSLEAICLYAGVKAPSTDPR
jgi:hypothetical protein